FSFTVTAKDAFNNTATGFAGTVHFSSSDAQAVLPANSTLSGGAGSFSATLKTAGSQTLTAADTATPSITGASNGIAVSAAAATRPTVTAAVTVSAAATHHFQVTAPPYATPFRSFSFTVTAKDAFNNTATGYGGTVHFSSGDAQASLPANSTLSGGSATFLV